MQVAFAALLVPTVPEVDEDQTKAWRIKRLQAAVDKLAEGNKTKFGKLMGFQDGAYIRQMLVGKRPISEHFIREVEGRRGMAGWFGPGGDPTRAQIIAELAARDIPEEALQGVLQLLQSFPRRVVSSDRIAAVQSLSMDASLNLDDGPVSDATEN